MHDEKKIEEIMSNNSLQILDLNFGVKTLIQKLMQLYAEHMAQQKVELFREKVWNLSKPNFDSINDGQDTYTIRKQDLNLIVKNLMNK